MTGKESTNPNPDLYPFWAEPEDLKPLTDKEKQAEWKVLFDESLARHEKDMCIFLDTDRLLLGWFRVCGDGIQRIVIRALVQQKSGTLVALPLQQHENDVAWSRPWMASNVYQAMMKYRRIVPPGVF